ncbi:MAG: hypothetical protein ACLP5E_00830 [Streptosporangiaceae bacterium]
MSIDSIENMLITCAEDDVRTDALRGLGHAPSNELGVLLAAHEGIPPAGGQRLGGALIRAEPSGLTGGISPGHIPGHTAGQPTNPAL